METKRWYDLQIYIYCSSSGSDKYWQDQTILNWKCVYKCSLLAGLFWHIDLYEMKIDNQCFETLLKMSARFENDASMWLKVKLRKYTPLY